MKFGTGSTTELTLKRQGEYKNDIRTSKHLFYMLTFIYINKYSRFAIVLPLIVSRLLLSLANYDPSMHMCKRAIVVILFVCHFVFHALILETTD